MAGFGLTPAKPSRSVEESTRSVEESRWQRTGTVLGLVWRRRGVHRIPVLAGGISYFALLSAAPTFTLLAFFGSRVLSESNQIHDYVFEQIETFMGTEGANRIEELVLEETQSLGGGLALILAFLVALWSSSLVFTRLKDAMDLIWDVTPSSQREVVVNRIMRPIERWVHRLEHPRWEENIDRILHWMAGLIVWLIRKGAGILTVTGLGLTMVAVVVSVTIITRVESLIPDWLPSQVNLSQFLVWLVAVGILGTSLFLLFLIMPTVKVPWTAALVSGLVTGAAMAGLNIGFGAYLGWTAGRGLGATASALLVLMLWIYLEVGVLLSGVELSRALTETSPPPPETTTPNLRSSHPAPTG